MGQSEASEKLVVFFFLTPQLLFGFASGPRRCLRVFTSSGDAHLRVLQSCLSSLRVRPQLPGRFGTRPPVPPSFWQEPCAQARSKDSEVRAEVACGRFQMLADGAASGGG